MINVSHLTKKYNRFVANDNMSFIVNDGEIAVLAGPNGAGKSTAIKCIAGLLRFSGEIEICGHNNKSRSGSTWNSSQEPTDCKTGRKEPRCL